MDNRPSPIIEITDLSYRYPDDTPALNAINFTIQAGERIAIIGPNGAGKTTLVYHLNGILSGKGEVRIQGLSVKKENLGKIRGLVGIVFHNPDDQLFSPTVFEDVAFGPIHQGFDDAKVQEKVNRALAAVHMEGYEKRNPYHLSSGEKKRIAIATVLSMEPAILVFDEPTAGLDPRARRELIDLLGELSQTMLIATHDLNLARLITSRTIILRDGKIQTDGETGRILDDKLLLDRNGLL